MKKDLRIVFMGTPEFASASLEALISAGHNIVGVVTAPDKPAGRGKKLTEPHVKVLAKEHGLKVLQPTNLKSPEFLDELHGLKANLGVVVAFRMLPEVVWSMPQFGTFNLHGSLLPQYRGAAPINHAVMNGESETGVTTFFLKHEIDTGDIIFQERLSIDKDETVGEVHDRLMQLGATLVVKTVEAIREAEIVPLKQSDLFVKAGDLKMAPKIYKDDCRIDWANPVMDVYNKIRGLSPYPAAFTVLVSPDGNAFNVKIYKAGATSLVSPLKHGNLDTDGKSYLSIYTINGKIDIFELQISGKKRMNVRSFLNGFTVSNTWKML